MERGRTWLSYLLDECVADDFHQKKGKPQIYLDVSIAPEALEIPP